MLLIRLAHVTIHWSDENNQGKEAGGRRRKRRRRRRQWPCLALGLVLVTGAWTVYMLHLEIIVVVARYYLGCFKGMRPLREYHVSFDYVLSC